MQKRISVIIPAYNAEKTIEQCIGSVVGQTYSNLEIIVINDGSNDGTAAVVEKMAEADNRIRLISIPNGGVSHARNIGLDNATGDYITFVDSDDTIEENMYEILIGLFSKYDVDIAHCSYNTVFLDGTVNPVGSNEILVVQSNEDALICLISGKLFASGLWNKLYKKELFFNVRLNENIKFNEDGLMNFELFCKADKSVYIDNPLYNYVQYEISATHTANQLKYAKDGYVVSKEIYDKSKGTVYEEVAKRRLAVSQLGLYGVYSMNKKSVKNIERKETEKYVVEWKKQGLYSKNDRIKFILFRYFPTIYKLLYRAYDKVRVKKLDPEQKVN